MYEWPRMYMGVGVCVYGFFALPSKHHRFRINIPETKEFVSRSLPPITKKLIAGGKFVIFAKISKRTHNAQNDQSLDIYGGTGVQRNQTKVFLSTKTTS